MDQFVDVLTLKRYQNLLEISADETERRTIQKMITEEEAKQALMTGVGSRLNATVTSIQTAPR